MLYIAFKCYCHCSACLDTAPIQGKLWCDKLSWTLHQRSLRNAHAEGFQENAQHAANLFASTVADEGPEPASRLLTSRWVCRADLPPGGDLAEPSLEDIMDSLARI